MKFKQIIVFVLIAQLTIFGLELKNGAYNDLVISISESVPSNDCKSIIANLQVSCLIIIFQLSPKMV